jgi:hypothetical protein
MNKRYIDPTITVAAFDKEAVLTASGQQQQQDYITQLDGLVSENGGEYNGKQQNFGDMLAYTN